MPGFSEPFRHWLPPSEDETKEAVTKGTVVLDTNVLLDAYRFAAKTRAELFEALERLEDRLWLPHQVALEFHKNRVAVIAEHDASYRDAIKTISNFRDQVTTNLGEKLESLSKRVALPDGESDRLQQVALRGLDEAVRELERLRSEHGIPENAAHKDPILEKFERLLSSRTGEPLSEHAEKAARDEAARRIKCKEPPGYEDRKKTDPHGDYLLWRQALNEVMKRKTPLLIVTQDVKEDWFWRVGGKTMGARPELVDECKREAGVGLSIMATRTFLYHASKHLKTKVSDDTLRQVDTIFVPHDRSNAARLTPSRLAVLSERAQYLATALEEEVEEADQRIMDLGQRRLAVADETNTANVIDGALEVNLRERDRIAMMQRHYQSLAEELARLSVAGSGAKVTIPSQVINRMNHEYMLKYGKG
ncbi:PIN domain-containing protein [Micromonospora sp. NPDC002717]|uniref:PIN domain-containing protein n=1 Tax=Micromonospora sp. NPDC002717 TaxID=3154424 RepID=UPI00331EC74D